MAAREIIKVQACGIDGNHGTLQYGDKRAPQADYGRKGLDGRSSTNATDGTPGSDARVRLSYSPTKSGYVMVTGEGAQSGYNWEMPNTHALHLDCRGGEGGNGGRGEDGQQGGNGAPGRNATKYSDATAGENGAQGGAAGAGTNGANGARAGNVFIAVAEHDLDTLIGVTWDVTGGKGGLSGTHGTPGDGGQGGRGGDGYAWTERRGNTVYARAREAAPHGAPGAPGQRPGTYLSGGQAGAHGSCQIRVIMKDLTEATYPDRYRLQVVGFDVVDENEDNINEPGEHLCVRNIRVQNFGGMPSPGRECPIKILVHGTQWLQPVESEPLYLPNNIPVGSTVDVPGTLRCLIRSETEARAPGQQFFAKDTVSLIASFDRLGRTLAEFNGRADIDIQYPLVMDPPNILMSVAKGDLVRFHWTLRNISSKAYGFQGDLRRSAASVLVDPGSAFNLSYSDTSEGGQAVDEIDFLEPGATVPIDQDFRVSNNAEDYSYAFLRLELQLSNPNPAIQTRTVASMYGMQLQISGKYTFDPYAQFLLVVNSHTPLFAIHQIRRFIWNNLSLRVDTFNISLYGSLKAPETDITVLSKYVGKSIIIFGNTLPFFNIGDRQPWDLLDPWELCTLAKAGTNVYIASPSDFKALDEWVQMVSFPVSGIPTVQSTAKDAKTAKALARSIQKDDHTVPVHGHPYYQLDAKKATPQVKQMSKRLPLKRFLAIRNENGVALVEGLPKSAQIFSSNGTYADGEYIADGHAYMIIRSIPFASQVKMFWNLAGRDTSAGISRGVLYAGLPDFQPREGPGSNWQSFVIERRWLDALAWSIESQVGIEVARFCSRSSWPDSISSTNIISQLPLLNQLLSGAPKKPTVTADNSDLLISVLGTVRGSTKNIGFGRAISQKCYPFQLGSRKAKLRKAVRKNVEESLKTYAPSAAPEIVKGIRAHAKHTKKEIKGVKGKKVLAAVSEKRLTIKTGTNTKFVDLNTGYNKQSIAPKAPKLQAMTATQGQLQSKKQADEAHSMATLNSMINPDGDSGDEFNDAPIQPQSPASAISPADYVTPTGLASELPSPTAANSTPLHSQPFMPQAPLPVELGAAPVQISELPSNIVASKTFNVAVTELSPQEVH